MATLPVLQHTARANAPVATLLLQHELLTLQRHVLAAGSPCPAPVPEGVTQPGPPRGANAADAVAWYSVQQSLLCALQVLLFHHSI